MSIYDDMQDVASGLLKEFDQTDSARPASADPNDGNGIYYVRVVPGNGPAQNPGPSQETSFKLDGVARGVSFRYIDHKEVIATDLQVTIAVHPDFEPNEKGFVLVNGKRHKVIKIIRKPAAGTPVAWTLIIRK